MVYVNEKVKDIIHQKRMIKYSLYLYVDLNMVNYIPYKITGDIKLKPQILISLFYHYRNISSAYTKKWGMFTIQSGITEDEHEYYINNNLTNIFDSLILNDGLLDCPYVIIFMYPNGDEFWISRNIGMGIARDYKNKDFLFEYMLFKGKVNGKRIIKNNISKIKSGYLAIVSGTCTDESREQFLIDQQNPGDSSPTKKSYNLSFI